DPRGAMLDARLLQPCERAVRIERAGFEQQDGDRRAAHGSLVRAPRGGGRFRAAGTPPTATLRLSIFGGPRSRRMNAGLWIDPRFHGPRSSAETAARRKLTRVGPGKIRPPGNGTMTPAATGRSRSDRASQLPVVTK